MTPENTDDAVRRHVDWVYRQLATRPQLFGPPAAVESVVMALEGVLDAISGSSDRPGSYRAFLGELGYGMRRFESQFEAAEGCRLAFVPVAVVPAAGQPDMDARYSERFAGHWASFLEWRHGRAE